MPRINPSRNSIQVGDCVSLLRRLKDGCIDLTVSSPPYDQIRTYNGFVFDFEAIANELYRVTKPGGVLKGRDYLGFDISEKYVKLARRLVKKMEDKIQAKLKEMEGV